MEISGIRSGSVVEGSFLRAAARPGPRTKGSAAGASSAASEIQAMSLKAATPKKDEISELQKVFEGVVKYTIKELAELGASQLGELVIGWIRDLLKPKTEIPASPQPA